jgi:hypothetical protein
LYRCLNEWFVISFVVLGGRLGLRSGRLRHGAGTSTSVVLYVKIIILTIGANSSVHN